MVLFLGFNHALKRSGQKIALLKNKWLNETHLKVNLIFPDLILPDLSVSGPNYFQSWKNKDRKKGRLGDFEEW